MQRSILHMIFWIQQECYNIYFLNKPKPLREELCFARALKSVFFQPEVGKKQLWKNKAVANSLNCVGFLCFSVFHNLKISALNDL